MLVATNTMTNEDTLNGISVAKYPSWSCGLQRYLIPNPLIAQHRLSYHSFLHCDVAVVDLGIWNFVPSFQ
jgi:hypothetical protein